MENDKKVPCTVLAVLFVLLSYAGPFICLRLANKDNPAIILFALAIPVFLGIINTIYIKINFEKISRATLLRCAIIVKYMLIPMYKVGALMIALFFLLIFTPVVIMIFVSPFIISLLSAYGYLTLLAGNAFSLAYIRKAKEEGVHSTFLCKLGKIFQFFFAIDIVSLAILSMKEKKYIGATITVIVLSLLGFIGTSAWLIVIIMSAFS